MWKGQGGTWSFPLLFAHLTQPKWQELLEGARATYSFCFLSPHYCQSFKISNWKSNSGSKQLSSSPVCWSWIERYCHAPGQAEIAVTLKIREQETDRSDLKVIDYWHILPCALLRSKWKWDKSNTLLQLTFISTKHGGTFQWYAHVN